MKDSKKNPPTSHQTKHQGKTNTSSHIEGSMAEKLETRKILSREGK